MIGGGLGNEVEQYVYDWRPERWYQTESNFQNDLQNYLDARLNDSGGMGMGLGGNQQVPVKREFGQVHADVAVGEEVGIELKRDFTNSQKHRLSGQITDYTKEFPSVLVVACGISDMDGWRELQNEYAGTQGFGVEQTDVRFIHKQRGGSNSGRSSGGGLFGGDGLL